MVTSGTISGHELAVLLGVYTVRSSDRLVGRRIDQSDRPVGQTVAEPPTSVNEINVACFE